MSDCPATDILLVLTATTLSHPDACDLAAWLSRGLRWFDGRAMAIARLEFAHMIADHEGREAKQEILPFAI